MKEKKKSNSSLAWLMAYAGRFRWLTRASLVLSGISAAAALMPFVFIWNILRLAIGGDYAAIPRYGWLAVGTAAASLLVYIAALMCSHLAAFRVASNIRRTLLRHILNLPAGQLGMVGTGRTCKTITETAAATETYLAHQLPDKAGAVVTPAALTVLLAWFDWRLGFLSLVPVALSFAIMARMTGSRMRKKMKEYSDSLDTMSNEAVEYVRGVAVVKTFGQTVWSFRRFRESIERYCFWVIGYTKDLRLPMIAYTTAVNATFAMLVGAALWAARSGPFSAEYITNLLYYIIITPVITVVLTRIMYLSENKMVVADAIERVNGILALRPLPEPTSPKVPLTYDIQAEDIAFSYDKNGVNAIDGISFRIEQGQRISLVGDSGGGKTTLAGLVARMWDTDKGSVLIGGINVKDISRKRLAGMFSFVFQDQKILKASVLGNVRMGKPSASRDEVMLALRRAQCDDIVSKLPMGIDTIVGRGLFLSGGEAQRITIARQILKDAPIVVLDEATAFADPDNEKRIRRALSEVANGKTVITIAHRLESAQAADRIYMIADGMIAEQGTHAELLAEGGRYARMWNEYNNY